MERFDALIEYGVKESFTDIHITGGHPLVYRRNGVIDFQKETTWSHQEVDGLVEKLLMPRELLLLQAFQSVDIGRSIHSIRLRINVFNTTRGLSLAVRLLPGRVPEIGSLNLHPSIRDFAHRQTGLILICGPTGCGKSTTIAAMVEEINRTRSGHIVTLEDPIEYRFKSKKCFIEQRELGSHIPSFDRGLYDVLRENPDVIVVGELRDPETIRLALNAVESGHLLIASLHASNSEDAIYRVCNSFAHEAQEIVRHQLASTLSVLLCQRLVFLKRVGFRVPVLSILTGSTAIKGMVRDNRLAQLESAIQTGRADGMMTMEQYKSEYIDERQFFTLPQENFKPSQESTQETIYRSRLMQPHDDLIIQGAASGQPRPATQHAHPASPAYQPPEGAGRPAVPGAALHSIGGGLPLEPDAALWEETGNRYEIDEAPPMDELIAEMYKKNH